MTATETLLTHNGEYSVRYQAPAKGRPRVTVIACMDARLDVWSALGLAPGEATVVRNAGGIVSEDAIRSLSISQHMLGTEEVVLIHHTDCGMTSFTDDEFAGRMSSETGHAPPFAAGTFTDVDEDVRRSMAAIQDSPFVKHKDRVRGFVFEIGTGHLREVH